MAWKKGQSGNPAGRRIEKLFREPLIRALAQDDGRRIRQIADRLVNMAADGDLHAIRELLDRVDGRPQQSVDIDMNVTQLDDAALDAHIAALQEELNVNVH